MSQKLHFGLIGDGIISKRHRAAIEAVGGMLRRVCDPKYEEEEPPDDGPIYLTELTPGFFQDLDYVVICTPTILHRHQTTMALEKGCEVICEKPLCLPWEPLIDDDRINVCLQLRYMNLPKAAEMVKVVFYRNREFFQSWKGDPRKAGGNIYEFFIHYIDLAILLNANFEGIVNLGDGPQVRQIYYEEDGPVFLDLMELDMNVLYERMYLDIIQGGGIKPKDIFYLVWVLERLSDQLGFRSAGVNSWIKIGKEFLR